MCGELGLVAAKPAAMQGSGWTCVILPSCVLQQFSCSPCVKRKPLQPLLLVTTLLWRAPGQTLEMLSLHLLPLPALLPLSRHIPRKPWAQAGKEQGKEDVLCLWAWVTVYEGKRKKEKTQVVQRQRPAPHTSRGFPAMLQRTATLERLL